MSNDFFNKTACDRCGADLRVHASTMSRFNTEAICIPCEQEERQAPGYPNAAAVELEAVRRGVRNFPGVGLSHADRVFLAERRALRNGAAVN